MSFQVRQFEYEANQELIWKFKLGNITSSQLDFYSQEASVRSLFHLAKDFSSQIDQSLSKKFNKQQQKNRVIRKLAEKIIKSLQINLQSFAHDIEQPLEKVTQYFKKSIQQTEDRQRIQQKCKQWIITSWLSLSPQNFYKSTDKFMNDYIKGGKKLNPDFQILNQLYVITTGDNFKQKQDTSNPHNDNLVLIDINLNVEQKYISQSFLWDSDDISNVRIKNFASHFLKDCLAENKIQLEKQNYQELQKQIKIQIRAQILYKTLLKRYMNILLNFSAIDIPTQVKQYTIPISLKLISQNQECIFQDDFQWDILNQNNNVQQFAAGIIQDYNLPKKYYSQLCYKIRSQINSQLQWKFDLLVKTFKSIHKDRQSPKLNTQTISILRKNVTYAMDVSLPCTDQKTTLDPNMYFNNSDLFSLLSRNIDILPQQFQEILINKNEKQKQQALKQTANQILIKSGINFQNNPYMPGNVPVYTIQNIWKKALAK